MKGHIKSFVAVILLVVSVFSAHAIESTECTVEQIATHSSKYLFADSFESGSKTYQSINIWLGSAKKNKFGAYEIICKNLKGDLIKFPDHNLESYQLDFFFESIGNDLKIILGPNPRLPAYSFEIDGRKIVISLP